MNTTQSADCDTENSGTALQGYLRILKMRKMCLNEGISSRSKWLVDTFTKETTTKPVVWRSWLSYGCGLNLFVHLGSSDHSPFLEHLYISLVGSYWTFKWSDFTYSLKFLSLCKSYPSKSFSMWGVFKKVMENVCYEKAIHGFQIFVCCKTLNSIFCKPSKVPSYLEPRQEEATLLKEWFEESVIKDCFYKFRCRDGAAARGCLKLRAVTTTRRLVQGSSYRIRKRDMPRWNRSPSVKVTANPQWILWGGAGETKTLPLPLSPFCLLSVLPLIGPSWRSKQKSASCVRKGRWQRTSSPPNSAPSVIALCFDLSCSTETGKRCIIYVCGSSHTEREYIQ